MDRLGGDPVLDRLRGLLGSLGHVLGSARLLEQRAVLQHRQVEVAEVDPVGARQQQLALAHPGARPARSHRAATARYSAQWPPLVSSPSLMKSTPAAALQLAHLCHRFAEAFVGDVGLRPHIERRRQRADVGGENPVCASPHGMTPYVVEHGPVSIEPATDANSRSIVRIQPDPSGSEVELG